MPRVPKKDTRHSGDEPHRDGREEPTRREGEATTAFQKRVADTREKYREALDAIASR